jgi:hypothetical protein
MYGPEICSNGEAPNALWIRRRRNAPCLVPSIDGPTTGYLTSLASPQANRLSILLQLCDQSITVFHSIGVLLVLVIRSVRLDNTIDPVNGACDSVTGNEFGKIPVVVSFLCLAPLVDCQAYRSK